MKDENYQKLREYALKLLSFRPRANKEISGKLLHFSIKRGISSKIVGQVIEDLMSQKLINDEEFVKWWIDQRQSFRPKGMRVIKMELLNKGVEKEIIDKILLENPKNQELEMAFVVANKKISLYKNLSPKEIKIKLGNLLARYGFSWEVIYQVIDSLLQKS